MPIRLQKFLSDAGVASRRASEQLILEGRVSVNSKRVQELGVKVDPSEDRVTFDGRPVQPKQKLYVALNKPKGCICSRDDPEGRHTIYAYLPKEWANLYTVGRLDYNSEGLIFLTNDGDFCLRLTHPRYGVCKKYRVTLESNIAPEALKELEKGIFDDGERLKADRARFIAGAPGYSQVEVELTEGKNREVRRMFEAQKIGVKRLLRTQIGSVKLAELPTGRWRVLVPAEVKSLTQPGLPKAAPVEAKRKATESPARKFVRPRTGPSARPESKSKSGVRNWKNSGRSTPRLPK